MLGALLTAEGHAIGAVAQGVIGSDDGRWLLFARCPRGREQAWRELDLADWEIALLDRVHHRLHARPGRHFGGLPFFQTFESGEIRFEISEQP